MAKKHELTITDASVMSAIRYLDPELADIAEEKNGTLLVIYLSLTFLLLGYLGLLWLWHRVA